MNHLDDIQIFVLTAEMGSFSRVSGILGMSPSSVGRRVSCLEERLGVTLIRRSTRGLDITTEGRSFAELAGKGLNIIRDATTKIKLSQPGQSLRVNAFNSFGHAVVTPALGKILREHKELSIELTLDDRYCDPSRFEADVYIRFDKPKDSSFIFRPLVAQEYRLYAHKALHSGLEHHTPVQFEHEGVIQPRVATSSGWKFSKSGQIQRIFPRSRFSSSGSLPLLSAARAGFAPAFLPRWLGEKDCLLRELLPEWKITQTEGEKKVIYAMYPKELKGHSALEALLQALKSELNPGRL